MNRGGATGGGAFVGKASVIIGVIRVVGVVASVIVLAIIGLKYMVRKCRRKSRV